jgi:acyl-CoA synthetase (AMP-forming)/AMP-acid ligase II
MPIRDRLAVARARDLTLGTLLERLAAVHPGRQLVCEDGPEGLTLTYGQAADLVARWAGDIRTKIAPGDRVVIATPNSYRVLLLCLAVCRAGGIAVPVNTKMRPPEIAHVVDDAGATLVIRSYDEVTAAEPVPARPADPRDVAALLYTSGTTGRPKGAELTHRALIGMASSGTLLPISLQRREAVSALPVAHVAGLSMLLIMAGLGMPVYLLRSFRPDTVLDAIEQRRASLFVGVPTMYRMMLEAGAETRDLRSVRLWASGADAMPYDLARRFQAMGSAVTVAGRSLGHAAFVDGYGMVELAGGVAIKVSLPGVPLPVAGLLGIPLPRFRLKVVDDSGRAVAQGEVGELVVRGPGVMRGYHGRREAELADGWLRTGDLARRRPLGLVEFVGRKKDVIKHGGYSVFAAEVEEVLEQHPAVAEAAVVGLPDAVKGQLPAAVVRRVGPAGFEWSGEAELRAWAAERLAEYKVPVRVIFIDDLPRTGTDKVDKRLLLSSFGQSPGI